nr:DMT family transporter [Conchiformibius steedae]
MMSSRILIQGFGFATAAAALNASIGIFSKILLAYGWNAQDIAFIKTLSAALLLTVLFAYRPFAKQQVALYAVPVLGRARIGLHIALCAFLGIFTLFYFETVAYQYGNAANVVVVLMASAAVSALVLGKILLGEQIVLSAVLGTAAAVVGITLVSWTGGGNWALTANAALAGAGYGAFSVLVKKFRLNGGLRLTRAVMWGGAAFLLIPFVQHTQGIIWNAATVAALSGLVLLPTVLGFYCTTKALNAFQRVVRTVICCFIGVAAVGGITTRRILGGGYVHRFRYCLN